MPITRFTTALLRAAIANGGPRAVEDEHRAIVEATLARNATQAGDLLEAHLQKTADILLASDAPFTDVPSTIQGVRN